MMMLVRIGRQVATTASHISYQWSISDWTFTQKLCFYLKKLLQSLKLVI